MCGSSTERVQRKRVLDKVDPGRKHRKLNSTWLFGDIELAAVVDINNVIWFRGVDAAKALEFKDYNTSLYKHLRKKQNKLNSLSYKELSKKLPINFLNIPKIQPQTTFINEQELYNFISQSRQPKAQTFQNYIFKTILPSIRTTEIYENNSLDLINNFINELNRRDVEAKEREERLLAALQQKDEHHERLKQMYLEAKFLGNMPLNDEMKNEYCVMYRKFTMQEYPDPDNRPQYPYYVCRVQQYSIDSRKKQLLKQYPHLVELCCLKVPNSVNYFNYIIEQMGDFIVRGSTRENIQSFSLSAHLPVDDPDTFWDKEERVFVAIKKMHKKHYKMLCAC